MADLMNLNLWLDKNNDFGLLAEHVRYLNELIELVYSNKLDLISVKIQYKRSELISFIYKRYLMFQNHLKCIKYFIIKKIFWKKLDKLF